MRLTKSFTLVETFVALFIATILTLIAIPIYTRSAERARAQEAVNVLHVLRGSQLRYAEDHGRTSNQLSDLDVEFTDPGTYFDSLQLFRVDPDVNPTGVIVRLRRTTVANPGYGRYVLEIDSNATITCADQGTFDGCSRLNL